MKCIQPPFGPLNTAPFWATFFLIFSRPETPFPVGQLLSLVPLILCMSGTKESES